MSSLSPVYCGCCAVPAYKVPAQRARYHKHLASRFTGHVDAIVRALAPADHVQLEPHFGIWRLRHRPAERWTTCSRRSAPIPWPPRAQRPVYRPDKRSGRTPWARWPAVSRWDCRTGPYRFPVQWPWGHGSRPECVPGKGRFVGHGCLLGLLTAIDIMKDRRWQPLARLGSRFFDASATTPAGSTARSTA